MNRVMAKVTGTATITTKLALIPKKTAIRTATEIMAMARCSMSSFDFSLAVSP